MSITIAPCFAADATLVAAAAPVGDPGKECTRTLPYFALAYRGRCV